MNIVLIGYRGTGKSTVGKVLATRLGRPVVSTDAEIVRRAGRTVPEIVAQHGWDHFRDLESTVCQDFSAQDGLIIDTGGGAIGRAVALKENRQTIEGWRRSLHKVGQNKSISALTAPSARGPCRCRRQ